MKQFFFTLQASLIFLCAPLSALSNYEESLAAGTQNLAVGKHRKI